MRSIAGSILVLAGSVLVHAGLMAPTNAHALALIAGGFIGALGLSLVLVSLLPRRRRAEPTVLGRLFHGW